MGYRLEEGAKQMSQLIKPLRCVSCDSTAFIIIAMSRKVHCARCNRVIGILTEEDPKR